jgi:hypothetical protein
VAVTFRISRGRRAEVVSAVIIAPLPTVNNRWHVDVVRLRGLTFLEGLFYLLGDRITLEY